MNEPYDPVVLSAYLLGDLPPDVAAEVEQTAKSDPSLAAKLETLAALTCVDLPSSLRVVERPQSHWTRRQFVKGVAASLAGVAVLGGAAYAGYEWLKPLPLVEDDFDDDWLDTTKWYVYLGRRGVRERDGHVRLMNRGSIVTRREFSEPIEVSFDWMWVDRAEDRLYSEVLKVALRTSGQHYDQRAYEVKDGLVITFGTEGAYARIEAIEGNELQIRPLTRQLARSQDGTAIIKVETWHHIRITDDGRKVAVYLTGPRIDRKFAKVPVVEAEWDNAGGGKRIAIYNREFVGDTPHESRIDNFKVYRLGD